ncbi:hypothetical protein BRADI_5g26983v3 [Brachypodium distachyon]|uniref:Uncharacterized protein n=1 Tax=Brachypodium distachyon TaxID=15368 RepID=A0A0Q3EGE9_BRADI|nr:hypothetical protein BRADI_5g26983v3 [Brachypodium distachyon]KQJ85429.1 hypothetical protein BRADI_5g26983v3 [Brachypodium distachyon]
MPRDKEMVAASRSRRPARASSRRYVRRRRRNSHISRHRAAAIRAPQPLLDRRRASSRWSQTLNPSSSPSFSRFSLESMGFAASRITCFLLIRLVVLVSPLLESSCPVASRAAGLARRRSPVAVPPTPPPQPRHPQVAAPPRPPNLTGRSDAASWEHEEAEGPCLPSCPVRMNHAGHIMVLRVQQQR